MAITSANQLELLQTAEAVAREKMIDPGLVVEAMEERLARAAKSRYGSEMDIRVSIDRRTGRATFTRVRTIVDEELLENYQAELTAAQAAEIVRAERPAVSVVRGTATIHPEEGGEPETRKIRRFLIKVSGQGAADLDQTALPEAGDEIVDEVPPVELGRIAAPFRPQLAHQDDTSNFEAFDHDDADDENDDGPLLTCCAQQ